MNNIASNTNSNRAHTWTFFRQWLLAPLKIASIVPSGRQLAEMMIAELPVGSRRVIELGGGTGVFTSALLNHGIVGDDLMVVELNAKLHAHLQRDFPQVHVIRGDAGQLERLATDSGYATTGLADAVISGLGMRPMPKKVQVDILAAAFACMRRNGHFVQFTYGSTIPVTQEVLDTLGLEVRKATTAWRNLPPASVYVFTRKL